MATNIARATPAIDLEAGVESSSEIELLSAARAYTRATAAPNGQTAVRNLAPAVSFRNAWAMSFAVLKLGAGGAFAVSFLLPIR